MGSYARLEHCVTTLEAAKRWQELMPPTPDLWSTVRCPGSRVAGSGYAPASRRPHAGSEPHARLTLMGSYEAATHECERDRSTKRRARATRTYLCGNSQTDRSLLPGHVTRARRGLENRTASQWARRPVSTGGQYPWHVPVSRVVK